MLFGSSLNPYMHDLISLQVSLNYRLICPTRLIFLAMGEVLSFGFNLAVLDSSDRRGTDMYCIVAIEDNKMGFSSYCMTLSLCIMSSRRYSIFNLVL